MKKYLFTLFAIATLLSCSDKKDKLQEKVNAIAENSDQGELIN